MGHPSRSLMRPRPALTAAHVQQASMTAWKGRGARNRANNFSQRPSHSCTFESQCESPQGSQEDTATTTPTDTWVCTPRADLHSNRTHLPSTVGMQVAHGTKNPRQTQPPVLRQNVGPPSHCDFDRSPSAIRHQSMHSNVVHLRGHSH